MAEDGRVTTTSSSSSSWSVASPGSSSVALVMLSRSLSSTPGCSSSFPEAEDRADCADWGLGEDWLAGVDLAWAELFLRPPSPSSSSAVVDFSPRSVSEAAWPLVWTRTSASSGVTAFTILFLTMLYLVSLCRSGDSTRAMFLWLPSGLSVPRPLSGRATS